MGRRADVIVTRNLRHFLADTLNPYDIEVQHPDDFAMNQLELRQLEALEAVKNMRARLNNPVQTPEQLVTTLERCGLPLTAGYLRSVSGLI